MDVFSLVMTLVPVLFFGVFFAVMANTIRNVNSTQKKKPQAGQQPRVPISAVSGARRVQLAQAEKWRAAKEQQDDAEQLHAIHIDSCESKLESLRVLYEAGILDKEEYEVRVARTKARHNMG